MLMWRDNSCNEKGNLTDIREDIKNDILIPLLSFIFKKKLVSE